MRQFLTWAESVARLNTDDEGLRQSLELGRWRHLRAYLRASERGFLSTLDGEGVALSDGYEGIRLYSRWDSDEPTWLRDGRTLNAWGDWDDFCNWEKQETSHGVTGYPAVYLLYGFLRVVPWCVKVAAQQGYWSGVGVTPPNWWDRDHSPVPLGENGEPTVHFVLLDRNETTGHRRPPEQLQELWFSAEDIESLTTTNAQHVAPLNEEPAPVKLTKLRSDREQNLLRVIAAMWALSDLPKEHNTAADKLSALMDGWKWDKPAASTIADTILKEAANLPGARVRS